MAQLLWDEKQLKRLLREGKLSGQVHTSIRVPFGENISKEEVQQRALGSASMWNSNFVFVRDYDPIFNEYVVTYYNVRI